MNARKTSRTQPCDAHHAATRSLAAEKFLEVAHLLEGDDDSASWSVAASLAVLAGIAASDVACCKALALRSRGQDHHDAEALLQQIVPGGKDAATALRRLVSLKDKAQYGLIFVSRADLKVAIKQAEKLLTFANAL